LPWRQHKDEATKKAKELLEIEKTRSYGVAKASHGIWNRKCKAKEKELNKAIDEQKSSEAIELLQIELLRAEHEESSEANELRRTELLRAEQESSHAIELRRTELQDLRKGKADDSTERGFSF
jgi:hypothetical protein